VYGAGSERFSALGAGDKASFNTVNALMTFLRDIEHGTSFANVAPEVLNQIRRQAGQTNLPADQIQNNGQINNATDRKLIGQLKNQIVKNLRQQLGGFANVNKATTTTQFQKATLNPGGQATLQAQGYNLSGINSIQSMLERIPGQTPQPTTSGGVSSHQMTGAEAYQQFSDLITSNPASAQQMIGLMNQAGVTSSPIQAGDTNGALAAFAKVLGATPAGQDPYAWLTSQTAGLRAAGVAPAGTAPSDPYSYVQSVSTQMWGTPLNDNQINAIVAEYPNAGASSAEDLAIRQLIGRLGSQTYAYDPNQPQAAGAYITSIEQAVKTQAGAYAVPLDPNVVARIAKQVLSSGDLTSVYSATDDATSTADQYFQQVASSMYPALKGLIQQGNTTQDILGPYKQVAGNLLGQGAQAINIENPNDPMWASLLSSPTGQLPSLTEWGAKIMQDPRTDWIHSQDAYTKFSNMANTLASTFGKVGGGPQQYTLAGTAGLTGQA
jgi:hypothetical protein